MDRIKNAIAVLKGVGVQPFADGRYGIFLKPTEVAPMLTGVELDQSIVPPELDSTTAIVAGEYLGACDIAYVWQWATA
jgi:hypothetical protein